MRRSLAAALLSLVLATSADAQIQNKSLKLNYPALGNQYLVVGDQTDLDGSFALGYTIEAWIHPTTFSGYPTIVGNDYQNGFWLGLDIGSGQLRWWPLGSDQGTVLIGSAPIPLNQWTHIAATYDAPTHTARLYINGVQDVSNSSFSGVPDASAAPFCIGADRPNNAGASFFWRGWIDEVKFWNRAVGSSQIAGQRFHRPGTPKMAWGGIYDELAAYWDMEDPVAGIFHDRWSGDTQAANDASLVNGGSVSATIISPIAYNHGLYFSGLGDFVLRALPPGYSFEDGVTIEAWIAPQGPVFEASATEGVPMPYRTILGRVRDQSFHLGLTESNRLRFYPGDEGGYFESNAFISLDEWTHVAAVYRPGLAELFINGTRDAVSTAFTEPPYNSGQMPLIGADPPALSVAAALDDAASLHGAGEQFLFSGWMDEVRLTGGALGATTIRAGMFRSAGAPEEWVPDELGTPRLRLTASLDPSGPEEIYAAGGAAFVISGAPLFGPDADLAEAALYGYRNHVPGLVSSLPSGANYGSISLDHFMAQNFTITDVNAFVSLSSTSSLVGGTANSLENVQIELEHPGISITLMAYGDGRGRDLLTVFDDESPLTFASALPPYVDGVRADESLTTLEGFPSSGTWHLNVSTQNSARVCVWAWGLSFNDVNPLAVDDRTGGLELRLTGTNPVRSQGSLAFSLPAADQVSLELLDVSGRRVRTLLDGSFGAGRHEVGWNARDLAPGLYFLRLARAGGETRQLRVAVVR